VPDRFDYDKPENQRKLDLVEDLLKVAADAGLSLTHLAMAWVLEHPAVTSAIIGPRTFEHLEAALDADKVTLTHDVLDRIDEIVPPGTTINDADTGYVPPAIADASLRRRTPRSR